MSAPQLFQLYAPLAGLLVLAFWVGALSQRVKNLEEQVSDLRGNASGNDNRDRLVRLETKVESMADGILSLNRSMQGVQRQLGNLMMSGPIKRFTDTLEDQG